MLLGIITNFNLFAAGCKRQRNGRSRGSHSSYGNKNTQLRQKQQQGSRQSHSSLCQEKVSEAVLEVLEKARPTADYNRSKLLTESLTDWLRPRVS